MKRLISAFIAITLVFTAVFTSTILANAEDTVKTQTTFLDATRKNYNLVFDDEFDGTSLDMTKWKYAGSTTHRNWEKQTYDDSAEDGNTSVCDGNLVLEAKKEDRKCASATCPYYSANGGVHHYTSGSVEMKDTEGFKYGLFEARIKLPANVSGVWPAFWSLGHDDTGKCTWPTYGEIDVMEHFGRNYVYSQSALHYGATTATHKVTGGGRYETTDIEFINGFHTFGILWTPTYILFYLDDSIESIVNITDPSFDAFRTFKQAFILNIALGGAAGGTMDDTIFTDKTAYPDGCKMYVDYVRAYQPKDSSFDALTDVKTIEAEKCSITGGYKSEIYWGMSIPNIMNLNKVNVNTTVGLTAGEIEQGNYDVYLETRHGTNMSSYNVKINGVKTLDNLNFVADKSVMKQNYIGTVNIEDTQNMYVSFTCTASGSSGYGASIDKVILVKSGETPDVTINNSNNIAPPTTAPTTATTTTKPTTVTQTATPTTTATIATSSVTTKTYIYGDANEDGDINGKDILLIKQYTAEWDVQINLNAADVNVDGDVNNKDSLLLKKYFAEWDVQLGIAQ